MELSIHPNNVGYFKIPSIDVPTCKEKESTSMTNEIISLRVRPPGILVAL